MPTQYYLQSFGIIEVSGEERQEFLQSQFSNDISALKLNEACYATYNNPKGRVIANFIVCCLRDNLLILVKKDLIPTLIKKLNLYKLRSKVNLIDRSNDYQITGCLNQALIQSVPLPLKFSIQSNDENITVPCPNGSQFNIYIESDAQLRQVISDENDWNYFEIQQGFPWVTEKTSEKCVAQMLNQEWLGALHFKKGCYPGQEVIARSQYRGEVKRRPALLHAQSKHAIGSSLYQEQQEVGLILNIAKIDNKYIYLAVVKVNSKPTLHVSKEEINDTLELQKLFYYQKESE
ncbi:folate-binding protein [Neisseriaceae bacterium PsAf]|nr:folate-binding protein [Neisseriaceae bacterium PsAf]MCV2502689.1 folate-binding protein [Neisseriaceae bacterium]